MRGRLPPACESWKVKDIVGHLIDTTEGYFAAFETARSGTDNPAAYGLPGMHERAGSEAKAFGELSQPEAMARVRADLDKMMGILEPLTAEEWTGFMVPHFYMGPLPAFFYAAGQLMDYGVHSWDIRQGTGHAHGMSGDAADLLVPFMFVLWQSTIKPDADLSPFYGRGPGHRAERRGIPGSPSATRACSMSRAASTTFRRCWTSMPGAWC